MNYPEYSEARSSDDDREPRQPLLDGTVHIEEHEDEPAPRVMGLIELLNRFLCQRQRN